MKIEDEDYPLVTSTTDDEEQSDLPVSMDGVEDISDDEDNPVMAELSKFLEKITRETSSSNPTLMNNITQIYADMKRDLKTKGGQKRSAISSHEDQSQAKRRSV